MAVIACKEETINLAINTTDQLMEILVNIVTNKLSSEDPADHIYLLAHIAGSFLTKIVLSLEGYGKTYGIENLNEKKILKFIDVIMKEDLKFTRKNSTHD